MAKEQLPHEKPVYEYIKTIEHFKTKHKGDALFDTEITQLEGKLEKLKENVYSKLTPWQRVTICRHPERPHTVDYIDKICDEFQELCGDRSFRDDRAVIGGFATIGSMKCMVIGQEKGNNTEDRIKHNFGMPSPEGYRKALRLMRLAEKFQLPVVLLLDTPGAYPGLEAEERGQGWAIALNLREMARVATPMIVVVIGEGCSGGALGMGMGDRIGMLEHSYYSVISPEGCASILWKDAAKREDAAQVLKLNSEDHVETGVIDDIIAEPLGGAHHDREATFQNVKKYILDQWKELKSVPLDFLLEQRYFKFRKIGEYVEKGTE